MRVLYLWTLVAVAVLCQVSAVSDSASLRAQARVLSAGDASSGGGGDSTKPWGLAEGENADRQPSAASESSSSSTSSAPTQSGSAESTNNAALVKPSASSLTAAAAAAPPTAPSPSPAAKKATTGSKAKAKGAAKGKATPKTVKSAAVKPKAKSVVKVAAVQPQRVPPKAKPAKAPAKPTAADLFKMLHQAQKQYKEAQKKLAEHNVAFKNSNVDLAAAVKAAQEAESEVEHLKKLGAYVNTFFGKARSKYSTEKEKAAKIAKYRATYQSLLDQYTNALKTAHATLVVNLKRTACMHDIAKICPDPRTVCVLDPDSPKAHYRKCVEACVFSPVKCNSTEAQGETQAVPKNRQCVCEPVCPHDFCSSNATLLERRVKQGLTKCIGRLITSGPDKGRKEPICVNPCKVPQFLKMCKDQGDYKCVPSMHSALGFSCVDLCNKRGFKCPNSQDPNKQNDVHCSMKDGNAICQDPCKLLKTPCAAGFTCERDAAKGTAVCEEICPQAKNPCEKNHKASKGWKSQCANIKNQRHCIHACHVNPATGIYPCQGDEKCHPASFARDLRGYTCEPACPKKMGDRNPCPSPDKPGYTVCKATGQHGKHTCHHPCAKAVLGPKDPCDAKTSCVPSASSAIGALSYRCADMCTVTSCPSLPLSECTLTPMDTKDGVYVKQVQCKNPCTPERQAECAKQQANCQPAVVTATNKKPYKCSNTCNEEDAAHCLKKKTNILCRINEQGLPQCHNPCHAVDPLNGLKGDTECAKHNKACMPDKFQSSADPAAQTSPLLFSCAGGCEAFKPLCEAGTTCVNTEDGPTYHKCAPTPAEPSQGQASPS